MFPKKSANENQSMYSTDDLQSAAVLYCTTEKQGKKDRFFDV